MGTGVLVKGKVFVPLTMKQDQTINKNPWYKRWGIWGREIINIDGDPYLKRLTILKTPLFSICIHWILRSDKDRCLHDHPWSFISFVMSGEYFEYRKRKDVVYPVVYTRSTGSIVYRSAKCLHRVQLPQHQIKPVKTLVIMFWPKRKWGFMTKLGWVSWKEYVDYGPATRKELCGEVSDDKKLFDFDNGEIVYK